MNLKTLLIMAGVTFSPTILLGQNASAQSDTLKTVNRLKEVVVRAYGAERNLKAPEMGRVSLSSNMIANLPVMFGEPDIVKALQTLPGVSQGMEGFTGLYVRGGDNDQNLFLYQGLPLYHVSHLGGIFSSFNVETVDRVDFYKASFPARYGGRISSITDIAMREPDFNKFGGKVSVGLLNANVYVTGPIIKGRTAFSAGLRRSWIDLLSAPTLAIVNAITKKNGKKHILGYSFTDMNLRLDHKINRDMSLQIVGYYGYDRLKLGLREFDAKSYGSTTESDTHFFDENSNRLAWGNWGVIGNYDYRLNRGMLRAAVYYSKYSSNYRQEREYQTDTSDPSTYEYSKSHTSNSIADIGAKVSYMADFSKVYTLRAGVDYANHNYLPEGLVNSFLTDGIETVENNNSPHVTSNEVAAYVDNTLNFNDKVAFSVGVRGVVNRVQGTTFADIEPRASLKVALGDNFSVKAGYARMHQYVQQVSTNYIDLPTDLWQPVSARFKPLQSDLYSIGVYGNLPWNMYFSVEGWYKDMDNLLEYREGVSVLNPDLAWEDKLTSGKGWSYGVDLSVTREVGKITGTVGYGLLWNWRKFDDLNQGVKFPAKFDNRHKININASYKLNEKIEFNAGWTFTTGNRMTLSTYNYDVPGTMFPDAPSPGPPGWGDDDEVEGVDLYSSRNNVRLPANHRLDLGMTIHVRHKNGHAGMWNISIYNAYCHMNAITIKKDNINDVFFNPDKENWHRAFKTLSLIPIIPSFSYTYYF